MSVVATAIARDLAPTGTLRAAINLGNPVLAAGTPTAPTGVTVDIAREAEVAFTAPYVVIEGVFAVPSDSAITTVADVDREGVRVGVKEGSAYDLFLSRTLQHASVLRGDEGTGVFCDLGLEVAAGIRQPMTEFVSRDGRFRLVEGPFMQICQAVGTTRTRSLETVEFLRTFVEELKASGFVADALRRADQPDVTVAPPG